ncbi:P-type conjugative transfer protein VirB9 [Legionella septentrionalis]|uniref:P-type conjugative transfer protein VirB9 n=1 Tax=Legionella septentrionalis TaxID=2498109 RepID=UPI000F8D2BAA|nr:P-type conjugative transfer protein VirB9 [Legionella septentrionalis]RUR14043.1 P-type conjugative transfer protein VirB9 [Legionella septentrionalis]
MKKIVTTFVLSCIATALQAQNNPSNFPTDQRIKQVTFQENNVVPIYGKTFTTTQIEFAKNEGILDVEGGDTTAWMVTVHPELPNMLFVKPTALNSNTNMTVITNQHTYYFQMSSNKNLEANPSLQTYALKFTYPVPKIKQSSASVQKNRVSQAPKAINTAYRFSGSSQLVPLHVFDDGQFTYFELSPNSPVPAIFAVDDKSGREATVNTRRQGKYLVIQRIAPQFTLRQGGLVTSVFNGREISRIQANRRPQ